MDTKAFLDYLTAQVSYQSQIAHIEHIPTRPPTYAELDSPLASALEESLKETGLLPLYTHQAEAVNQADSLVYQTEKMLKDYGDKVSAEDKVNIEREIENTRSAVNDGDADKIKQAVESLTQASYKISESMYKEAASAQSEQPGGAGEETAQPSGGEETGENGRKQEEDVVDAEYEVVDDDKNAN